MRSRSTSQMSNIIYVLFKSPFYGSDDSSSKNMQRAFLVFVVRNAY